MSGCSGSRDVFEVELEPESVPRGDKVALDTHPPPRQRLNREDKNGKWERTGVLADWSGRHEEGSAWEGEGVG